MPTHRSKLLIFAGGAMLLTALLMALIGLGLRSPEPQYRGQPVAYWLEQSSDVHPQTANTAEEVKWLRIRDRDAREALRSCGPDVLPYLVTLISREPPVWEAPLQVILLKILPPRWRWLPNWSTKIDLDIDAGMVGFNLLGEAASAAIPDLHRLALAPCREKRAVHAISALCMIGPTSLPTLMSIATNTAADTRYAATCVLGHFGTSSLPALPLLLQYLSGPDTNLAIGASEALGHFALAPDVVVPALNKALCNPNPAQRIAAARALSFFGEPAIPVLRAALEDPSPEVHDMITNAIYGIESAVH